jgi:rod shape determining protein RodA
VIATHKWLFAALMVLSLIGVVAIYSCTHADAGTYYASRQLVWTGFGVVAMVAMTAVKTRTLSSLSPLIYLGAIGLLVLVLVIGKGPQGTRRWFDLGFFRFQPSEVAKFATLLMLARYMSEKKRFGDSIKSILFVFAVVGLPAFLTLYKFKSSLVTLVFGVDFLLYSLGPRLWESMAPYQRDRVMAFLHPEDYRHGAGFQIIQSKIAIGSGGLTGKGLLGGTQKALGLVPEQHTDFVFSVIGEELGFLGSILVLLLLFFVVWRLLRLAGEATNRFSVYLCFGLASLLVLQVFINVGMTLGLTPVTGLPLPFLSYGGSQAVVFWGMIGAALAAHASAKGL